MRGGRLIAGICAAAAAALVAGPGALAATPREIYKDYADNGRLDTQYSRADLERASRDALIQGYGGPDKSGVKGAVQAQITQRAGVESARRVGALPFTGLDLALMAFGGGLLLLLGAGLRRFARGRVRA
jgi:hypothetical protein